MIRTRVGYAGGTTPSPTYRKIGDHAETLQVDYDPRLISYEKLLAVFFDTHNACHKAWSRQYMSAIWTHDAAQLKAAKAAAAIHAKAAGRAVATEIKPLVKFTRAEDYHQKYRLRSRDWLFRELSARLGASDGLTDSTAAMRLNAWLSGYGDAKQIERELPQIGLPEELRSKLQPLIRRE